LCIESASRYRESRTGSSRFTRNRLCRAPENELADLWLSVRAHYHHIRANAAGLLQKHASGMFSLQPVEGDGYANGPSVITDDGVEAARSTLAIGAT
jgi:hypothetical protein